MNINRKSQLLNFGIILFIIFLSLYYFLSEKITMNDGFGWDGNYLSYLVSNVYDDLANQKIDSYYIRRILPSILVSIPAHLFDLPITRNYIIFGFVIANILCIIIAFLFWLKICQLFKMSFSRTIVSLILLFGFYWILKGAAYNPVLTDLFAFASSVVMLYFYVKENTEGLAAMILLSLFIWPSTAYVGSFLLLFSKRSSIKIGRAWLNIFTRISYISALGIIGAYFILRIVYHVFYDDLLKAQVDPLHIIYWLICALFTLIYIYYCIRIPMENFKGNVDFFEVRISNKKAIIYWIIVIGGCLTLQYFLTPIKVTMDHNIRRVLIESVIKPLVFIVSDITYYGAAAIFCILFFRPMLKQISNLGLGTYLTVLFGLVLNMYPEPRFILNVFPFFILAITLCGPFDHLTKKQWFILIITQIIYSKLWLPIGARSVDWGNRAEFPAQFYYLNFGVWMNNTVYVVQAIIAVITITIFYRYFLKNIT